MESKSTGLVDVATGVQAEVGTVVHEGREYRSGGAYVDDYAIVGYLKGRDDRYCSGEFQTWNGDTIGHYVILSTWKTPRSYLSDRMISAEVTLRDGRKYIVRGAGNGMLARGKRAASQLRPIRRSARSF